MNAYITGSSLVCNIADNKQDIISNLKNISPKRYQENLKEILKEKTFYKIYNYNYSQNKRFHKILEKIISDALKEAKISKEEQEDLHIFFGSTSMEMGTNEEFKENFDKDASDLEFKSIGYGAIGQYIEKILNSKHKATLFSTACTSSVNALAYAAKMIERKKIKKAIVIGFELFNKSTFGGFSSLMLLSQSKIYRPFDKNSDGIILGEGCSAVILENEKKEEDNFKYISSSNICDNYSETTSDPTGTPIFEAMNSALNAANLQVKDLDCIKAHATGSENNNSSEAKALAQLFDTYKESTQVTALKPILGHTLGACGTNEIVLMIEAIKNSFLPATFGFEEPIENLAFTPILENKTCENKQTILLNYVAFGGNNSSIILSNKD
ncbi:beta-ketoacyl synthase [Halarcobacter mediterraneus]|uniref:Beta-ketoacyl synthase n=1 Tax=Halarcobacter mediterraneus TaxID=2023153 RepID=A0A4Q1B3G4_9BACT|nr:beta-ketoacyl synthase N-terminal-like domain-containing protein [Halarcobacter mediterraneus]RXK12558.1 beta-ketoacyl synthase [Halarcobacter mediterraneus]